MNPVERQKYVEVWQKPEYRRRCHALDLYRSRPELFKGARTLIDWACGTGRFFAAMNEEGRHCSAVDFVGSCLDPDVRDRWSARFIEADMADARPGFAAELSVCVDAMEHVPENEIRAVLGNISRHSESALFLIANYPSRSLGAELHMTQKPAIWWMVNLAFAFEEVEQLEHETRREVYLFRCS